MSRIEISNRLRPVRFGFLIRPNDGHSIQRFFEINTCLWGGRFNPIIPYFEHVPKWWSRHGHNFYTSKQIIEGYLSFFEPDFVVEGEQGLAKKLNLPDDLVVGINDFKLDNSPIGYNEIRGLNTLGIYRHLYDKEFKYMLRHNRKVILTAPVEKQFYAFNACILGSFPKTSSLAYFRKAYQDAFDPAHICVGPVQLEEIYRQPFLTPLSIACDNITVRYSDTRNPTLFILDATQFRDLMDFWNWRAYKRNILAIPVQWIEELSGFCREYITHNHKALSGNPHGVMNYTTVCFSRSLRAGLVDTLKPAFSARSSHAVVFQDFYPRIGGETSDMVYTPHRPTITAKHAKAEVVVASGEVFRFDTMDPDFIETNTVRGRWANVVNLRDCDSKNEMATVFPGSLRNPAFPDMSFDHKRIFSNDEGLVVYPEHMNWQEHWSLLDGTAALIHWFETQGFTATISAGGKTLLQILRSFQDYRRVRDIAHPIIIDRLNAMACKLSATTEETTGGQRKEFHSRTVRFNDIKSEFNNIAAAENSAIGFWKKKVLRSLVQHSVIKLGLEVRCSACDNKNWYALDMLNYDLVCENCLKSFSFPQNNPSNHEVNWSYRVVGPFAKPDYAQGAYTSAFAVSFFGMLSGGFENAITWATSLELCKNSRKRVEADFILWYQRKRGIETHYGTELIFGESKSRAKTAFTEKDLDNLKHLARTFPGSILVCATLKDQLDARERVLISRLALWGRERSSLGCTKAPVIVLTGTELLSPDIMGFERLWQKKGGRHAQLVQPSYIRPDNPRVLADLTQQMYLGLKPYGKWLEDKYDKRRRRRKRL